MAISFVLSIGLTGSLSAPPIAIQDQEPSAFEPPRAARMLVLGPTGRSGRTAIFSDTLLASMARGVPVEPIDGAEVRSVGGEARTWREAKLEANGSPSSDGGQVSWVWIDYESPVDQVALLAAPGCTFVYAGGEPRATDIYALGNLRTPVALRRGSNAILARVARGRPRFEWSAPPAPVFLDGGDSTLPDLVFGTTDGRESAPPESAGPDVVYVAAVLVTNASERRADGLVCAARVDGGSWTVAGEPIALLPLETRKVSVEFTAAVSSRTAGKLHVELRDANGPVAPALELQLAVRAAHAPHRRTFVSAIDGSVQTYTVVPSTALAADPAPGVLLTLHGAGVDSWSQATSYAAKPWAHVVAPTNRRPFGFDWEDWGRLDALEVLGHAEATLRCDPRRRWLTGHSMGGHGTWNLGVLRSDLFAAIAPSAGWFDFWNYAAPESSDALSPIESMLRRATNASRTLLLLRNLAPRGVYVLHGDADDNVPVSQARRMREELAKFHADFAYYERPGAGHWWGSECVDWPPLMEFLRSHTLAVESTSVALATVDLDLRDREQWLAIESVAHRLEPARASGSFDAAKKSFAIETEGVTSIALHLAEPASAADGAPRWRLESLAALSEVAIRIDGQELGSAPLRASPMRFSRDASGAWRADAPDAPPPARLAATFKAAMRNRFGLVYATGGTPEENVWAWSKARFDAEQFRYRGNASPWVKSDVEWLAANAAKREETGIVLYGNADTNRAWGEIVASDAVEVRRDFARVGERRVEGSDVAVFAALPSKLGSGVHVALVAGTGLEGLRATTHAPYFVSGAGFPDWLVIRSAMLERGADGIEGAGFFATDGRAGSEGDSAWREAAAGR